MVGPVAAWPSILSAAPPDGLSMHYISVTSLVLSGYIDHVMKCLIFEVLEILEAR